MTDLISRAGDLAPGTRFPWIADGFAFGGDYNPEQWPEEVWHDDIDLMREAGVTSVSLGIFSWGLIEVADGEYDFGWLDRVMDLLHGAGIGVNLATPTAAPPTWLHQAHPEILPVDADGVRRSQGGRLGWSHSSTTFRRYAVRIVEVLAERYGSHPALRSWHVGNEFGNENAHCYSDETAASWRRWLAERFATVDDLNEAWGTAFWGHHYTSFEQIEPPRRATGGHNPGLVLDFERFTSDALLDHYLAERAVLRRVTPHLPSTTNFMVQNHPIGLDYARWSAHVDLVANDHYTIAVDPARQGELAFSADRVRGMAHGDPWLLMEHSASAVNWQPRNRAKAPGELTRDSLAHIARGADGAMFFQWRQSSAGAEQFHSAIVPHAGADSRVFREVVALGATLRSIREVVGSRVERARVAILFDEDSATALRSARTPSVDLNSLDVPLAMHRALTDRGIAVDVVHPSTSLDGYLAVVVPTLFLLSDESAASVDDFVRRGGHAIVTYFSGIVTPHLRVITGGYPGALRQLLGVRVEEFFPLLEDESVRLDDGSTGTVWSEWVDLAGAETVARSDSGDLSTRPAITINRAGAGTAVYVSTRLDAESTGRIFDDLAERAGIHPVATAERGLELTRRIGEHGSWVFALNHGRTPLALGVAGLDLVTGQRFESGDTVAAGRVAVIRDERDR